MNFPSSSSNGSPPGGVTNRKPAGYPFPSNTMYPPSSTSSPLLPSSSSGHAAATLERHNDQQIDRLHEKASMLKHLTINLGEEIHESNKFLDTMSTTFVQTDGLLSSASRRLQDLSRSSGANFGCYITLFILGVLLFVYFGLWRK